MIRETGDDPVDIGQVESLFPNTTGTSEKSFSSLELEATGRVVYPDNFLS